MSSALQESAAKLQSSSDKSDATTVKLNSEALKENIDVNNGVDKRPILRAVRRFTAPSGGQKQVGDRISGVVEGECDEVPKPKFVFGQNLSGISDDNQAKSTEETKKDANKPFSFNFKFMTQTPFEKVPFGKVFQTEAKMFANKNLFANPMIKPTEVPSKRRAAMIKTFDNESNPSKARPPLVLSKNKQQPESDKPSSAFKAMPLVQANPLNSSDALKMRKEMSQSEDKADQLKKEEAPIVHSLFDVKGNSKFRKNDKKKEDDLLGKSSSSEKESEEEEEEKKDPSAAKAPSFIAKNHEFPKNPFLPKSGASSIFTTGKSLWGNPFAPVQHQAGPAKENSEEPKPAQVPAWLKKKTSDAESQSSKQEESEGSDHDAEQQTDEKPTVLVPNDSSSKLFQTQIESLKIIKGLSDLNPAPCKK